MIIDIGNKIVIWGAGNQGRAAYYFLNRKYEIVGFLDSDIAKIGCEIIDGKRVLDYRKIKEFIVIACGKWREVSKELQKKGFNLLIDFIPYNMLYMKNLRLNDFFDCFGVSGIHKFFVEIKKYKQLALIYGNCQTEIMANMLEYNEEFSQRYVLLRVPQIHMYRDEEQIEQLFYKHDLMQLKQLFIYQNVRENNRFNAKLGTKNILMRISNKCKKIPIHNIYFDGYFIQYDADDSRYYKNMNQKDFPYTDGIVDELIKRNKSIDEILELVLDEDFISKEEVYAKCEDSINNLRQREKDVDIPIVDYIEQNYRNEQLFYTYNHPKNIVMYEYVRRILKALGIGNTDTFTEEELNMEFGTLRAANNFPIYPCVISALGLKRYEYKMRISHITPRLVAMKEYIREYIERCYGVE